MQEVVNVNRLCTQSSNDGPPWMNPKGIFRLEIVYKK